MTIDATSAPARRRILGRALPFYGWAVVAVSTLVVFCSGPGQSYVFSVFLDPIIASTGLSRTTISALYAVGTGVSAVMVVIVSRLVDRLGARKMLLVIATALGAACFLMSSATGPLVVLLGFAALRALGQGSMGVTATLLANQWFVRQRGRAMAVVGLGGALSNALLPPLARFLIEQTGWRHSYMILGVMVWLLIIPTTLLLVRNRPEDIGLYPDGAPEPPEYERLSGDFDERRDRRKVLTSLRFWLLALPMAAPGFISTALVFHQTSIFAEHGLSASVAAGVFIPFALASAAASMVTGMIVDRVGPRRLFLINLLILLAAIAVLQTITDPASATLYAVVLGISSGAHALISGVIWAHYYGRRGLGRVQGSAMMINISGAAIGPLPFAALAQYSGGYGLSLVFLAGLLVTCWVVAAVSRPGPAFEPAT